MNFTKPPSFIKRWIEDSVRKLTMYIIHNTWVSYVSSTLSSRLIPKSEILHIPFSSTRMLRAARSYIHKYKSFNLSKLWYRQSKISYIFNTKLDRKYCFLQQFIDNDTIHCLRLAFLLERIVKLKLRFQILRILC